MFQTELSIVASISGYVGSRPHSVWHPNSLLQTESGTKSRCRPRSKSRRAFDSSDVADKSSGISKHAKVSRSSVISDEFQNIRNSLLRPQTTGSVELSPTRQIPKVHDIVNKLERKLAKTIVLDKYNAATKKGLSTRGFVNAFFGKTSNRVVPIDGVEDDNTDEVSSDLNSFNEYSSSSDSRFRGPYYGQSIFYNHGLELDDENGASDMPAYSLSYDEDKGLVTDYCDGYGSIFAAGEDGFLGEMSSEEERAIQDITNALEMCLRDTS